MRVKNTEKGDTAGSRSIKDKTEKPVTRRDFIATVGKGATIGGLGLAAIGLLRAAVPSVLPDPSKQFKAGVPADFPKGVARNMDEENVMIFRDEGGLFAISKVCTHLGCIVEFKGDRFTCPCHGSGFDKNGKVTQGPAPKPLDWLEVSLMPTGHILVDRAKPVPLGTKLKLDA